MSADLCSCLTSLNNPSSIDDFTNCGTSAIKKNMDELIKRVPQSSDLSEEAGYKAGYEAGNSIFKRVLVSMVNTCTAYFQLMDTMRYLSIRQLSTDSSAALIRKMDYIAKEKRGSEFYTLRGTLFFQNFMFDKALEDLDRALMSDKSSAKVLYYKAWALEMTKRYDESISIYNDLAKMGKDEYYVIAALVKRKKDGLK